MGRLTTFGSNHAWSGRPDDRDFLVFGVDLAVCFQRPNALAE